MKTLNPLTIGDTYSIQKKIEWEDTTLHYGSGGTETLLSTARLSDLMIETCVQFLDTPLVEGFVSLGSQFEVEHIKPSIQGSVVSIKASLVHKAQYQYDFKVEAFDEFGLIASGFHRRVIAPYKGVINVAEKRCFANIQE